MPRRPDNPGACAYCGEIVTKRGVGKHLDKCSKRQEALASAAASSRPVEKLWHLRVQDAYDKDFWLDLEMIGSASLGKLDNYLRAIWLECCGHLSMFTIGGWQGDEIAKSRKANAVFEPGITLRPKWSTSGKAEQPQNIRSPCWRATGCPKCCARSVTSRPAGCALNASTKRKNLEPGSCAMSM